MQFNASGTVSVNKATAADGTPGAQKINWATATGSLLPAFSTGLTSGVDLRIAGQASLDIFGFVVGTAEFTMAQGTSTVSTGNSNIGTAGTLNNASIVPVSRGGKSTWDNCVLADKKVNSKKGCKLPDEAGLKLLRRPAAPREIPVTQLIRNTHHVRDWEMFLANAGAFDS